MSALTVTCPACDATDVRPLNRRMDLCFHQCGRCELVFVHPQPTMRVRDKYVGEYDLASHFSEWESRKRVLYDRRLARLPDAMEGRNRLCDVGCADGQFLQLAAVRGWRVFGVELNPPAAEAARARGAEVALGSLEELDDLPWGQFDVVSSWDVLEHTPEPRAFSERVARLLAPGGTLVVTTLNYDSLVRRCFGLNWSMVCDDHFTYWNARSLRMLFESQGLKLLRARSFGLGRDFVMFLDRWTKSDRPILVRTPLASSASTAAGPTRHWDVNPLVLAVESGCDRLLNFTGSGVGIEATFCRQ